MDNRKHKTLAGVFALEGAELDNEFLAAIQFAATELLPTMPADLRPLMQQGLDLAEESYLTGDVNLLIEANETLVGTLATLIERGGR